jgi:hypothetical protein
MQVYLSERKGLICIRVLEGRTESAGCAHAEQIEEVGDLGVRGNGSGRVGIVLVLPNGVEGVTLSDHGGRSRRIRVANNVAEAYDSEVQSVAYRLADGALHTINIPAEFLHPTPPGFVDELTQTQIGERLGVSQMQVSRLLRSTLARLREHIGEPTMA